MSLRLNPWSIPTRLVRLFFVLAFIAFGLGVLEAVITFSVSVSAHPGLAVLLTIGSLLTWGFIGAVLLALSFILRLLLVLEARTRQLAASGERPSR